MDITEQITLPLHITNFSLKFHRIPIRNQILTDPDPEINPIRNQFPCKFHDISHSTNKNHITTHKNSKLAQRSHFDTKKQWMWHLSNNDSVKWRNRTGGAQLSSSAWIKHCSRGAGQFSVFKSRVIVRLITLKNCYCASVPKLKAYPQFRLRFERKQRTDSWNSFLF